MGNGLSAISVSRATAAAPPPAPSRPPPAAPQSADVFERRPASPRTYGRSVLSSVVGRADYWARRDGSDYARALGPVFAHRLEQLTSAQRWLDGGAGSGHAQADYRAASSSPAKVCGVGTVRYGDCRFPQADPDFRFIAAPVEGLSAEELGRCDLITNVHSALAYTSDMQAVLQRYVDAMPVGAELYGVVASTEVVRRDGRACSFAEWVASIPGLEAIDLGPPKRSNRDLGRPTPSAFGVRKVRDDVRVPAMELSAVADVRQRPVPRRFTEK